VDHSNNIYAAFKISEEIGTHPDNLEILESVRKAAQNYQKIAFGVNCPQGIDELIKVKIGGIDQWLHIRGRNKEKPLLLVLHGGPGYPMIGTMDSIQRPWEDFFTVVQWDQRQTGKSYFSIADDTDIPSISEMIADTEEVIEYLLNYLNHKKLFLLGHSWGTVLGMHMVKQHPDQLYAFVGVGQVVNMLENERVMFDRLLHHANSKGDDKLVNILKDIAPYPNEKSPAKHFIEYGEFIRRELSRLAGETMVHYLDFDEEEKLRAYLQLISPHLTPEDISNYQSDEKIALYLEPYSLTKDLFSIDLPRQLGSKFDVPIFFFTGFYDWHTPKVLSENWFSKIKTRHKKLVTFYDSSHFVFSEEPGRFLYELVHQVLPLSNDGCRDLIG